jgi:hypothetical protein
MNRAIQRSCRFCPETASTDIASFARERIRPQTSRLRSRERVSHEGPHTALRSAKEQETPGGRTNSQAGAMFRPARVSALDAPRVLDAVAASLRGVPNQSTEE